MKTFPEMDKLSDHLFWDVNRATVNSEKNAAWLLCRVLEYGRWSDLEILRAHYGKPRLAELAVTLRSLSPKTFAFCRAWFQLPESAFRCSTLPPFPHR